MTEDYVSFETAKLLKEKGFDELTPLSYRLLDGFPQRITCRNSFEEGLVSRITLQMAIKWLRTEHNIFFNVNYFHIDVGNKWVCLTIWLPYKNGCEFSVEGFDIETVYEDAIKYCLENLI